MACRTLRVSMTSLCLAAGLSFGAVASAKSHEVTTGDSLWSLARLYKTSVEAIKAANSLGESDKIRTGQKLSIPASTNGESAENETKASKPKPAKVEAQKAPTAKREAPARRAASSKSEVAKEAVSSVVKSAPAANAKPRPAKASNEATRPSVAGKTEAVDTPAPSDGTPKQPRKRARAYSRVDTVTLAAAEKLYADTAPAAPHTLEERAPAWVLRTPEDSTQVTKTNASRGGVYPCSAPDKGFGKYQKWVQVAPMAHLLAPTRVKLNQQGGFDVMFHFHGREPLRKEWVEAMDGQVLVAVDAGIDSGSYSEAFADARTFRQVVLAVEQETARRAGVPRAEAERIGLSAWSAGYGAIEQILSQPFGKKVTDSVILLDGLHAGYTEHSLEAGRLAPFTEFAEAAAGGEKFMFISHSSIRTTGYASTTETAQYLVWKVGGKPLAIDGAPGDPWGLERISTFTQGQLHVRGFRGNGTADHCAHIGLMSDILRVHLKPRWAVPLPESPVHRVKSREALALGEPLRSNPWTPAPSHPGDDSDK